MCIDLGPTSLIDDLLNGLRVWSLKEKNAVIDLAEGSISGMDGSYLKMVELALAEKKYFSKFKANRNYREILEHVNREQGADYFRIICDYGFAEKDLIDFCKQDVSKPFRYSYAEIGRVSPTNLRYAKVALDLSQLFGSLNNFQIAEIGIGYGGQCLAISRQHKFTDYTLFDLPQVVSLAEKYLRPFDISNPRIFKGDIEIKKDFDLVISNYAFSELTRDLQEKYLSSVILNSKRGYLIYNDIGANDFDTMPVEEFVERIPGSVLLKELPLTHLKNKLIVWGHSSIEKIAQ
jgi:hypothetical protein